MPLIQISNDVKTLFGTLSDVWKTIQDHAIKSSRDNMRLRARLDTLSLAKQVHGEPISVMFSRKADDESDEEYDARVAARVAKNRKEILQVADELGEWVVDS